MDLDPTNRFNIKIESTRLHLNALSKELKRLLDTKQYSSPNGARVLLQILQDFSWSIEDSLVRIRNQDQIDLVEAKLHRHCQLVYYLDEILAYLEGAEVESISPQIVQPIRRLVKALFPNSEIILVSSCSYNYTILDLIKPIRALSISLVDDGRALLPLRDDVPSHLFVISVPRSDQRNVLLHAILSHEIGHTIYDEKQIDAAISPIEVDKSYLDLMTRYLRGENAPPVSDENLSLAELDLRSEISKRVTAVVGNWKVELFSDAIGTLLFGPAFLFSTIHFGNSLDVLDGGADSHPPLRLRLKLIFKLVNRHYDRSIFPSDIQRLLVYWNEQANMDCTSTDPIYYGSVKSIEKEETLNEFVELAERSVKAYDPGLVYTMQTYNNDVQYFSDQLVAGILPISRLEVGSTLENKPTNVVSILNAGWHVSLCQLTDFKKLLPHPIRDDRFACLDRLNEVLIKAFELHDINYRCYERKR